MICSKLIDLEAINSLLGTYFIINVIFHLLVVKSTTSSLACLVVIEKDCLD